MDDWYIDPLTDAIIEDSIWCECGHTEEVTLLEGTDRFYFCQWCYYDVVLPAYQAMINELMVLG